MTTKPSQTAVLTGVAAVTPFHPAQALKLDELSMEKWSAKAAVQSELDLSRQLAGLTDQQLEALHLEFEATPKRPRKDFYRFGYPLLGAGGGLTLLSFLGFYVFNAKAVAGVSSWEVAIIISLAIAFVGLAAAIGSSFYYSPLQMAWQNVGVYVSKIDERHPWLYNTLLMIRDPVANQHRLAVLKNRGPLRGVDYILMQQVVKAFEHTELTQTAVCVAEKIQGTAEMESVD